MDKTLNDLTVLRDIERDPAMAALKSGDDAALMYELLKAGCEESFPEYVFDLIIQDENAFSMRAGRKKEITPRLKEEFVSDMHAIFAGVRSACKRLALSDDERIEYMEQEYALDNLDLCAEELRDLYERSGYGIYLTSTAFRYTGDRLVPIENPISVTMEDLKEYEYEKSLVERNITAFLQGLPSLNILLYGDKGTGKSSTVHAILNKYSSQGLRIIQLDDDSYTKIDRIRDEVSDIPLKFILFIDDISLQGSDKRISAIKASLEGSLSGGYGNSIIVATSNRRHIIRETVSDREDSLHVNEDMDERLSLSDRFGLTILFSSTNRETYLSIVRQLAEDKKLKTSGKELDDLAERWAMTKGGRSPRRAKQFVDLAASCEAKGIEIDF